MYPVRCFGSKSKTSEFVAIRYAVLKKKYYIRPVKNNHF